METINPGKVVNRFAGVLIGCDHCNGHFRLTESDKPHEVSSNPWEWSFKTQRKWYYVTCPTEGCRNEIRFTI